MTYTEQLERDTERTRLQLATTIDELRGRLTPGEILDEALDYAGETGIGAYLRSLRQQVIDNPLPLGLMGASVAWMMVATLFGGGSKHRASADARATADAVTRSAGRVAADAQGKAASVVDRAEELRAAVADQAADVAGQASAAATRLGERTRDAASAANASLAAAGDRIADTAGRSADAIGATAAQLGRGGKAASRAVVDFGREQPLLIAATGIVIGLIAGALLPPSETEDRLIGDTSDAAKESLREMAGAQYEKAKEVAAGTAAAAFDERTTGASPRRAAEHRGADEFGPGPGDHAGTAPSSSAEEEHAHADGN